MTLTLAITNRDRLENGSPRELVLHGRGAVIGRTRNCEWPLPDDARILSGRHCEIKYANGGYTLIDTSTNGTYLANETQPMAEPHRIRHGDRFRLGPYEIEATLSGEAREGIPAWADRAGGGAHGQSADQIFNSLTDNHKVDWTAVAWDVAPAFDPFAVPGDNAASSRPATSDPSGASTPTPANPFGGPIHPRDQAPASDPFAPLPSAQPAPPPPSPPPAPPSLATRQPAQPIPSAAREWAPQPGFPPPAAAFETPAHPAQPPHASPPAATSDAAYRELMAALGIPFASITEPPEVAAARAGRMLRRLLAGLMILLEARARAKDEMGASATQLRFDGNNPLKFARNVEQALQMMMNPARQGYMEADNAIEDSYRDLQSHQIATLRAMRGALRATLQRFSPASIKARAGDAGMLGKLVPGQREAALWRAYEKQFSGVAEGSAEAFLDIFLKEFRQAYEDAARGN